MGQVTLEPNGAELRRHTLIARLLFAVPLVPIAVRLLLVYLGHPDQWLGVMTLQLVELTYVAIGYVIVTRRRGNRVGWLIGGMGLVRGVGAVIAIVVGDYGMRQPNPSDTARAFLDAANVLSEAIFAFWLFALLLFPNGRLPSARWRIVGWSICAVAAIGSVADVLSGLTLLDVPASTPFLRGLALGLRGLASTAQLLLILTVTASLVWRWRRGIGVERSQLKWLAFAAVAFLLFIAQPSIPVLDRTALGFVLFPAAIGVAILRNRLFDINFVINRGILYGIVALVLVGAFQVLVSAIERTVGPSRGDLLAFVQPVAALAVVPAFRPLERRVRPLVDRLLPATEILALFFVDIVASTERLSVVGDARWRETLDRFYAITRQRLRRYGGAEVDTAGDSFFATFREPAAAARCALDLSSAVHEIGLRVRIGLHVGDCDMRGERPAGINVHVAARVMSAAGADEVLESESCRDALTGSNLTHEALGPRVLKGIPGEVRLFRLIESPNVVGRDEPPDLEQRN